MRIVQTDENLGVFFQRNRERNFDTERKMMIALLNALKGDSYPESPFREDVPDRDLLPSGR